MAFLAFLTGPIGRWLIVALLVVASYGAAYFKGRAVGWDKRDAVAVAEAKEADRLSAILAQKRIVVTERIVTKYVDRVKVIQGERVVEYVDRLIPASTPDLPAGFRWLHDTAASGSISGPPERIDVSGQVPVAVAIETIIANYQTCRLNAEQLNGLQEWVAAQHSLDAIR